MSCCPHHDSTDLKTCNTSQPWKIVSAIAQDPSFRVQTALLYIRSLENNAALQDGALDLVGDRQSQESANVKSFHTGNALKAIDYSKPDLGLLHLHRDRLAGAGEALGWREVPCLQHTDAALSQLETAIHKHISGLSLLESGRELLKLRILINKQNEINVDSIVIGRLSLKDELPLFMPHDLDLKAHAERRPCRVHLDVQATRPSTLTSHKSTHRCSYDSARARAGITKSSPLDEEVLLYNPFGEVMEASLSTVYFLQNGRWITPAAICGPHFGVTRRLAIEQGLAKQATIELRDLVTDEPIWLSNAVRGFFPGRLTCDADTLSTLAEDKLITSSKVCAGLPLYPRHSHGQTHIEDE